jgi:hypothetical protein
VCSVRSKKEEEKKWKEGKTIKDRQKKQKKKKERERDLSLSRLVSSNK